MAPAESDPRPVHLERSTRVGNQFRWPVRLARLLGRISDPALAARAGVSLTAVVAERRRRGIPPFRRMSPPVEWTDEMIELLGEASDGEVAAELGISRDSVAYKRQVLGIPAYGATRVRRPNPFWTRRRVALLGTATDKEVAARLGISRARVAGERRKRGVAPFKPRAARVVWTPAMVRRLGKVADHRVAERFGIGEDTVRRERSRRGIPPLKTDSWKVLRKPELRRLLRLQTNEVVRRTGLNEKTVRKLRSDLGIRQPGKVTGWTRETLSLLGRVPDEELAARLGLAVGTVRLKRNQAGIRFRVTRRWTVEEDDLVRRLPIEEAMRLTGRTRKAILHRRKRLGLPSGRS